MQPTPSKLQLPNFASKNNYFVVEHEGVFHYYPIRVLPDKDGAFLRFTVRPPLLRSGIVIFERVAYQVTVHDLSRGLIRKSSRLAKGKANDSTRTTSAQPGTPRESIPSSSPDQDSDERRLGGDDGLEIQQAADAAWEEQTRALLQALYQEEGVEWEVQSPA